MSVARVAGVGLLTGWGAGVDALPPDAAVAAAGRRVVALARPELVGERFRRATRECLLCVAAVDALLRDARVDRAEIAGSETALVFVTAAGYGSSNATFIRAAAPAALYFPYTAPSAVSGEVAIEFGLSGPYAIFIGGAATTVAALGHAGRLLATGRCRRALVLAIEIFEECEDLWAGARRGAALPLVEAAACALLVPAAGPASEPVDVGETARGRAGETLACAPLVALALARASGRARVVRLHGAWRGRSARLALEAH